MEILSTLGWEIFAPTVAVVGVCQAFKMFFSWLTISIPTFIISLLLSALAGFLSAHTPGPFTPAAAAYNAFLIYGTSTLGYEMILKRMLPSNTPPDGGGKADCAQ